MRQPPTDKESTFMGYIRDNCDVGMELTDELFDHIIDVANGKETKNF